MREGAEPGPGAAAGASRRDAAAKQGAPGSLLRKCERELARVSAAVKVGVRSGR